MHIKSHQGTFFCTDTCFCAKAKDLQALTVPAMGSLPTMPKPGAEPNQSHTRFLPIPFAQSLKQPMWFFTESLPFGSAADNTGYLQAHCFSTPFPPAITNAHLRFFFTCLGSYRARPALSHHCRIQKHTGDATAHPK